MKPLFSGKQAFEHLQVLAEEIGPRHGGSKNEARAARYINEHFKELGLKSRVEPYPIYSFEDSDASLTTSDGKSIPCVAVPIAGSTPAKGITKEPIFLEEGSPLLLDERVKDRIVVTFGGFGGDEQRLIHLSAAGFVSIHTKSGAQPMRAPSKAAKKRKLGAIPSVRVTLEDGVRLIENLPSTLTLKVVTRDEKVTKGSNVVADLAGDADEDDVIIVCAHFDSVWAGPGAIDNGGGTAAMMELARVYAGKGCRRNLRFVAFGGEEMGLWGARGYVKKLKDANDKTKKNKDFELDGLRTELDRVRFVVNLDMMGPLYGRSTAITLGSADIAAAARLLAHELRYPLRVRENAIYSSDNMAFNRVGISSISFNRCGHGELGGHTDRDVVDNCSAEGLAHIGHFVENWMDRYVLGMHVFPFPKVMPAAAKKIVSEKLKGKDHFDYKVVGPAKRYRAKKSKKA